MEKITIKMVDARFTTLNNVVSEMLGISLKKECSYGNKYRLYEVESGNSFPNNRVFIGKREFYESMGIMISMMWKFIKEN